MTVGQWNDFCTLAICIIFFSLLFSALIFPFPPSLIHTALASRDEKELLVWVCISCGNFTQFFYSLFLRIFLIYHEWVVDVSSVKNWFNDSLCAHCVFKGDQRIITSRASSFKRFSNHNEAEQLAKKENIFIHSNLNLWTKDFQAGFLPPPPRPPFLGGNSSY